MCEKKKAFGGSTGVKTVCYSLGMASLSSSSSESSWKMILLMFDVSNADPNFDWFASISSCYELYASFIGIEGYYSSLWGVLEKTTVLIVCAKGASSPTLLLI